MRARSAVRPPVGVAARPVSMRIGWRFGWTSSDSSRESVHFTGRPISHAASAVWAWLLMSSLPPNAPPFDTSSTVTRPASMPSTDAIWSRSSHTPWPPDYTCSPSDRRAGPRARRASTRARGRRARCAGSGTPRARRARSLRARRRRRPARTPTATARCRRDPTPRRRRRCDRRRGVGDRRQRGVLDLDQLRGGPRGLAVSATTMARTSPR